MGLLKGVAVSGVCAVCDLPTDGECTWDGDHPVCPDCGDRIDGFAMNGGRCLDCHERRLRPMEDWSDWVGEE